MIPPKFEKELRGSFILSLFLWRTVMYLLVFFLVNSLFYVEVHLYFNEYCIVFDRKLLVLVLQ